MSELNAPAIEAVKEIVRVSERGTPDWDKFWKVELIHRGLSLMPKICGFVIYLSETQYITYIEHVEHDLIDVCLDGYQIDVGRLSSKADCEDGDTIEHAVKQFYHHILNGYERSDRTFVGRLTTAHERRTSNG